MHAIRTLCRAFWRDARGVTSIEYALLGALIAMVIIGAVSVLGSDVKALYELIAAEMP
ncbi:Flp family type IVb pilin [Cupriavidus sp. D384]|uniref:Flp family type IVb pilin n=1 Tax=Cupriavidus sp. D384 TaxID=1538095 RepID=UPI000834D7EE|nr:Flp family type IVb pilin [Cupriavidus sp. D384]